MRVPRAAVIFAFILIASTVWILTLLPGAGIDPASGRVPLLAVSIDDDGNEGAGGVAYLDLRVINGSGNVYIHSEPLTKVDTQASTTFAQRYACDLANVNCEEYDFLYSIESEAPIVGGPSAGAATAALTYAVLTHQAVPQDVAITGTISSGGVIGTVGGIPQKIEAAANKGLSSVVIPYLAGENVTRNATISTVRARTLIEVLDGMGLETPQERTGEIDIPRTYTNTMRDVAADLCENQTLALVMRDRETIATAYERIENLSAAARAAGEAGAYYAQASSCFNVRVQHYYLELVSAVSGLSDLEAAQYALEAIDSNITEARVFFDGFESDLSARDLNEIQVYSIVQERLSESESVAEELTYEIEENRNSTVFRERFEDDTLYSVAYMLARIDSMKSWTRFSGFEPGPSIERSTLKQACGKKLSEASELAEYTTYLTGSDLDIQDVYAAYNEADYAVCVYQASLVTARAEAFLSTIGVEPDELSLLYEEKRLAAYDQIAEQDAFPVMAYSYYEYAESLKETNMRTALLYIENALALAELDLYLDPTTTNTVAFRDGDLLGFALGVFVMAGFAMLLTSTRR